MENAKFVSMTKQLLIFIFVSLFFSKVNAADTKSLVVPVLFTIENGTYDLSFVVVKKNGVALFTKTGEKNMKLKLEYGSEYLLCFGKEGYITKQILFNTSLPEGIDTTALEPYKIGVRIFKQYEGVNIVIYNQPVGFIHFIPEDEGFGYDTDYTKSILSELEATENILIQKSKEEKKKQDDDALDKKKEVKKEAEKKEIIPEVKKDLVQDSTSSDAEKSNQIKEVAENDSLLIKKAKVGEGEEQPIINLGIGHGEDQKGKVSMDSGEDKIQQHLYVASGEDPIEEKNSVLPEVETITHEIIEKNRKITEVEVYFEERKSIIRKVVYNWGGVYYYNIDNKTISEDQFYSIIKNSKRR
jgi:hypothetical protein